MQFIPNLRWWYLWGAKPDAIQHVSQSDPTSCKRILLDPWQKMHYVSPRRLALLLDCCEVRTPIRHAHVTPQGLTPQGVPNWTPAFSVSQTEAPLMPPSVQKKWPWIRESELSFHMPCAWQLWNFNRWRSWVARLTFASRRFPR